MDIVPGQAAPFPPALSSTGAWVESECLHLIHSPLQSWFTVAMETPKDAPLDGSQQ